MTSVGVALSGYQASGTIDQALASVAGQTRLPDQVVVVDDGSTDDTAERARRWAGLLPIEVVVHQRNQGIAAGRSTAISHLGTELVLALDADDVWLPHHLEGLLAVARPGTIISPKAVAWHPGRVQPVAWDVPFQPPPRRLDLDTMLIMNFVFAGSLFERAAFERAGGTYRFDGCEDWDLWLRMLKIGCRVHPAVAPSVLYRVGAGSLSADDRLLPTEVRVLENFIEETADEHLVAVARRSLRHRRSRLALREAYRLAEASNGRAARAAGLKALGGPRPVAIRGLGMAIAPRTVAARRISYKAGAG
jgi:glycosyltransferase involved in cell wall biosynthesis